MATHGVALLNTRKPRTKCGEDVIIVDNDGLDFFLPICY